MPHIAMMHYCNYNPWKGLASSRCPGEVNNDAQHEDSHLRSTRVIWDCSGTPMEWSVFLVVYMVHCTINSQFSVQLCFTHWFDPGCLDPIGGIVFLLLPWTFLGNHIYVDLHYASPRDRETLDNIFTRTFSKRIHKSRPLTFFRHCIIYIVLHY